MISKCLVTGGAGFIGSHIVEKLLDENHEVIVLDNEYSNNEKFYWNPKSENIKGDITDYSLIKKLTKNVDIIFHCAAESRIISSIENPLKATEINVIGTSTILQCAREANVKRVIYSSTSSGYGRNNTPNSELQVDDCLNPYSLTKIMGEKFCKMYTDLYDLPTISLRYFNVFGERSPSIGQYALVIAIFVEQYLKDEPLTIVGDGEQRRDFIYVKDVVEANYLAAFSEIAKEDFGEVYNVGFGRNISINHIANLISKKQINLPPRLGEVRENLADISKIKKVFGWSPNVSLEDWLKDFIDKS
tara:strand:+ start:2473 stop:3381 length:909 start_codon:yes stop_codon:yes gene_type:complete